MVTARILCADLAGLRAQAIGLAEAAGLVPDLRTITPGWPFSALPPALWPTPRWAVPASAIAEPLPSVAIGCGGAGARVAAWLRRRYPDSGIKAVAVQNPRMDLGKFDLVLAGRHDGVSGDNVVITRTALHQVTPARLAAAAADWGPHFAYLRRPLVAVLLGGNNGRYRFTPALARHLAGRLAAIMARDRAGLVITPSRRTPPDVVSILREALEPRGAYIWDGHGDNPYFAMLSLADAIIVTADSVSMVSEAAATAAPVLLLRLPGRSARIGAFMDALVADGRARDFAGRLELWDTAPLDDMKVAAAALRQLLKL